MPTPRPRKSGALLQERGPAGRLLEDPQVPGSGAGEGAPFVAEQFALGQRHGHGAAVDREEGPAAPRSIEMDRMRHQLRSEEHTSELQSQSNLVCRLLLEKKKTIARNYKSC